MIFLSDQNDEIVIENRPWRFALENSYEAIIGDKVVVFGIFEESIEIEPTFINNLTIGIDGQARDDNGRPLLAGSGRNSYKNI
jgi:hypothetical protein